MGSPHITTPRRANAAVHHSKIDRNGRDGSMLSKKSAARAARLGCSFDLASCGVGKAFGLAQ
jgi:hypothetical protein